MKGFQSNWTSSCSDFQGGSIFRATCHFVGRDLHFDLSQFDTKLDWARGVVNAIRRRPRISQ
ncbi:unnamed protein product [Hymenolepis diminuta]|uniref:Uncharacterized protein n=1 Tax=Hymenolepis diminuta TaxID=6216 RepID=A0A564Y038_HYMDI|nr:unnamed protein product [Hymenolepis diminuta]